MAEGFRETGEVIVRDAATFERIKKVCEEGQTRLSEEEGDGGTIAG